MAAKPACQKIGGSPPRAWGRRALAHRLVCESRFTPTSVGTARTSTPTVSWSRQFTPTSVGTAASHMSVSISPPVHPHERGDGELLGRSGISLRFTPTSVGTAVCDAAQKRGAGGSPPRAWGRRRVSRLVLLQDRFTPTSVGTAQYAAVILVFLGSPPRAWGRLLSYCCCIQIIRFTPTSVGTAPVVARRRSRATVHPHERGDGIATGITLPDVVGSPPRAWGRLAGGLPSNPDAGSPPRAWGRLSEREAGHGYRRFTPTSVGTAAVVFALVFGVNGSPPRAWGRRARAHDRRQCCRFTPTSVGTASREPVRRTIRRFTPTSVGTAPDNPAATFTEAGSPPRAWGRRLHAG